MWFSKLVIYASIILCLAAEADVSRAGVASSDCAVNGNQCISPKAIAAFIPVEDTTGSVEQKIYSMGQSDEKEDVDGIFRTLAAVRSSLSMRMQLMVDCWWDIYYQYYEEYVWMYFYPIWDDIVGFCHIYAYYTMRYLDDTYTALDKLYGNR